MDYQLASSSDIFDTIIARRCRSPSYIFLLMEQKLGFPSFCRLRISASRWAAQRRFQNHTFSDIYDELAIILNLDLEEVRSVMNLELSLERENEIPINLVKRKSRIFSGQLEQSSLSTDHYIIRKKTTGRVWQELHRKDFVVNRFGNSQRSDVHTAQKSGMTTE